MRCQIYGENAMCARWHRTVIRLSALYSPCYIAIRFALFQAFALVVLLLSAHDGDVDFDETAFFIEGEGDDGQTLRFLRAHESGEFLLV